MQGFFLTRWFNRISIAKKLYFTVGIMAVLIAVELATLTFAIKTLSSVRAYVNGEALWSKAQKDAVTYLRTYSRTRNEADYQAYLNFLKVPLGDRKFRLEMMKSNPDENVIIQGAIEGRAHPADVEGMRTLITRFHNISYINKAIHYWEQGEEHLSQLMDVAAAIHALVLNNASEEELNPWRDKIDPINARLTVIEDQFSYTLGEGSRWLEGLILTLLFFVALTVEITGLLLTFSVSRGISKGLNEVISSARKIAAGNFDVRAKVFSKDEIGQVAEAFNEMAEDLKRKSVTEAEAEEELRQHTELYETLLTAQSEMDIAMSISEGDKFIYVNDALCKMYGYSRKELLQIPSFLYLIAEEDRPRMIEKFRQRMAGESISDTGELMIRRKDAVILNAEYSVKMIRSHSKTRLISIIRDVTEKKKTEQALIERAEELKRINQELEQFAYVTSHDLQEPLRTIISYMQLINKKYQGRLDADADEYIRYAVDGANRMHYLIKDLLTYSRLGTRGLTFVETDTRKTIDNALDNLQSAIFESKATIDVPAELPSVMADRMQITMLFQNLVANAIKFRNNAPPKIKITCQDDQSQWKFAVTDNGIGISSEYDQRIFVIFQRLHTREKYPGTGIGLAICKKIVERHGGNIWMESNPGKGSTFYFTLKK